VDFVAFNLLVQRDSEALTRDMPPNLRKAIATASQRITKRDLSFLDETRLELKLKQLERPTKQSVRRVLAESLGSTETDALINLSAYDDSDRILDDIVNMLAQSNE
jgi:gluconate kinase